MKQKFCGASQQSDVGSAIVEKSREIEGGCASS